MEFELKSGKKLKFKEVSIDDRDAMLDSVEYEVDSKGGVKAMKMMHSTITKWIRKGVAGDVSDKFIKTLTMQDRIEIFTKLQESLMLGEENPSDSN